MLIERETALTELEAALQSAAGGAGRLVVVSGEAGVGKTALIEQFTRRHQKDARVMWGACDALFTPRPLGPLHDIAAESGHALLAYLHAESPRSALFAAFLAELQTEPSIVVFEDVHWADEATLDLLKFAGRRIHRTRSVVVLTYRDDELGAQHPLRTVLGDLATAAGARRLAVPRLSETGVRALVGERAINAASLYRKTGGNPFFVMEVLASGEDRLPATVRDAVLARAARLSASAQAVLQAAAVIGFRMETWLLREVTGAEAHAADECVARGALLAHGEGLAFRHELARQIILEALAPHHKAALHRMVLDALQAAPARRQDLSRLAHHAAGTGDWEAVLKFAPAAARQAAAAGAHREAHVLYALALQQAAHLAPAEHARMLEAFAQECNLTERQAEAIEARRQCLALWRELKEPLRQGAALSALTVALRNHGSNAEAEQAGREALRVLEALPASLELAMACRVQATLRLANREYAAAIEWGERAMRLAEEFGDADVLTMARAAVGSARLFEDYERGQGYLEEQLRLARAAGDEQNVANLAAYLGACSAELHEFRRAEQYLSEGISETADRGLDLFLHFMQAWLALTQMYLGRWEAAEAAAVPLQGPEITAISRFAALAALGRLRARRGDTGPNTALEQAVALADQTGSFAHVGLAQAAAAEAAWLRGDDAAARQACAKAYDLAVSKRHAWFAGELAYWRWRLGDAVDAPEWAARPFVLEMQGQWRAAAEAWEERGCPYEQARALAGGDLEAQAEALGLFEALGAAAMAERVRQGLQAAGAPLPRRPREATRANPFGLTARELEIWGLVAEGLTNPEIAKRLHVSPKTVNHHVSAVLGKLHVRTRQAAAALARRQPSLLTK